MRMLSPLLALGSILVSLLLSRLDDCSHIVWLEGIEHSEKELPLWELPGVHFQIRDVGGNVRISHRIGVEIFHRELLVLRDQALCDLAHLEHSLLLGKDRSDEAELGAPIRGKMEYYYREQ